VQSIRESGDSGLPAVMKGGPTAEAFQALAESLARQIAIRNANFTQTKRVEITTA
jgi:ATP-binding protein involved in chromosome partitioning